MKKPATRQREVRRLITITEQHCERCGKWFERKRIDARFCPQPATCRLESWRDAQRKANRAQS